VREPVDPSADPAVRDAVGRAASERGTRGRVVLRASGTEPGIRNMVEGEDAQQGNALAGRLADSVRSRLGR
jgi:phosphoglucosamine mutase